MDEVKAADLAVIIRLLDFVKVCSSCELKLETRLLEDAGLDSLGLIFLVEEIQRELKVEFLPEDYSFENLRSVSSVLGLVSMRRDPGMRPAR
jgi:acyl carrier protein